MKLNFSKFSRPAKSVTAAAANGARFSEDPYLQARNEWAERYGSYIKQAYNWRLLALLEAVALSMAVVGLIYVASQSKYVPYVVAVDKLGMAMAVHEADRAAPLDARVIHAQLATWIVEARSVILDRIVEKRNLDHIYAMVGDDSPARGYLNSWYSTPGNSPFDLAGHETDSVAIQAILPISELSYEVQWTETIRDLHGNVTKIENWSATCMLAFRPPADEATVLQNPLGMYITSVDWQKKL